MIYDILIPFLLVGLAELGDKTQLAILVFSTKTKEHKTLLLGVMLAFVITDGAAILFGNYIAQTVPMDYVKLVSGLIFIFFGVMILKNKNKDDENGTYELKSPFTSGFGIVLVSEMGDKTQLAAALFATQYNPFLVFVGVMLALLLLSTLTINLGKVIIKKIDTNTLSTVAGIMFILIGASFLI
jgi:putative Ca2+/H+ antiporter (TMEM165/GDT1 family)